MIFYFSGTGNSAWVAQELATRLNERLVAMGEALQHGQFAFPVTHGERVGFVFPTHAWGLPLAVRQFLDRLTLPGYEAGHNFTWAVTTCGDDVGALVPQLRKVLGRRGLSLQAAYSVQMPNTYVNMPGFDVDSDTVREHKLHAAPARIEHVAQNIAEGRVTVDVVTGGWAWVKTHVFYPWFMRHATSDRKFSAIAGRCVHCGQCQRVCPLGNISLPTGGLPQWHGHCTMCLSCLHHCPTQAIQHGRATLHKGRYQLKIKN